MTAPRKRWEPPLTAPSFRPDHNGECLNCDEWLDAHGPAPDHLCPPIHDDDKPFIVAEVSKNWRDGHEVTPGSGLIAQQFERVINHNHARGYRLVSFSLHRTMTQPDELNETIVAVFVKGTADDH